MHQLFTHKGMLVRLTTAALLSSLLGAQLSCGAGKRAAPFHENGLEPTECGSLDQVAPNLLSFMRSGRMAPIAEVMSEEIVPSGQLRTALGGLLQIAHEAPPPDGVFAPIKEVLESTETQPLFDLTGNVLRYLAGMAPFTEDHYGVTTALGAALTSCDQNGPLQLIDLLITTRLPLGCSKGSAGCELSSARLLRNLGTLMRNVALRDLLTGLTLSAVPEQSFVTLIEQMVNIATSPSFEFSSLRTVVVNNLYPLIDDQTLRTDLDVVLEDLEQLTQPQTGVQKALATTLICFENNDPNRDIYRLIYNIVVDPKIQFIELLNAVDVTAATDPEEHVAKWLHDVIGVLEKRKAAHNAIIGLVGSFLKEKNASRVIPTVVELGDAGATEDLMSIITRGLNGCSRRPLPEIGASSNTSESSENSQRSAE